MINKGRRGSIRYRIYATGDKSDSATQTKNDYSCFVCGYQWDSVYELYSHLLIHCHRNKNFFTCLRCKFKLNLHSIGNHDCFRNNVTFLKHKASFSIKYGLPINCLLCGGRRFQSKTMLFIHLICYHNPRELKARQCGKCPYKVKRVKPNRKLESLKLPNYNREFDTHIAESHAFGYDLAFIQQLNQDSERRQPYACVACPAVMTSNDRYEAHILCRHTSEDEYDRDMFVCKVCDVPYWSEVSFNDHVNAAHTAWYRQLANQLSRDGTLNNHVDLNVICLYCWSSFETSTRLHAHLLIQHAYFTSSIKCGLCSMDFRLKRDLKGTFDLFVSHNEAHYRFIEAARPASLGDIFAAPPLLSQPESKSTNNRAKKKIHSNKVLEQLSQSEPKEADVARG